MGDEFLGLDNILEEDEAALLFSDSNEEDGAEDSANKEEVAETIVDGDSIFTGSESVGDESDSDDSGEDTSNKSVGNGTSPNPYSSVANALREDGILPDVTSEDVDGVKTPEDFAGLIEKQVNARLEEAQRRVKEALDNGVEVDDIKKFTNVINYLDSISEDTLSEETDEATELRKNLIYQDLINRGFKQDRAKREVEKSINAGTDIEDAKAALESNKEYFKSEYQAVLDEAKEAKIKEQKERERQASELHKKIVETEEPFSGIKVDKAVRQAIYNNIVKPTERTKEGDLLTPIQKFEKENKTEFLYKLGLLFTLTDGFKNVDKLIKDTVRNEKKKTMRSLEKTLNTTKFNNNGVLSFVNSKEENTYSGLKLDI